MSLLRVVVLLVSIAPLVAGCGSKPSSGETGGSGASGSATTAAGTTGRSSATAARASSAAASAIGGTVVASTAKGQILCALVDSYPMCDGRPCRKDGLTATTYYVCRSGKCAGEEVRAEDARTFASQPSCVAACRRAETQARAKRIASQTFYCAH